MLKTIGFPGRYIQGPGALRTVGSLCRELGLARPVAERLWRGLIEADEIGRSRTSSLDQKTSDNV